MDSRVNSSRRRATSTSRSTGCSSTTAHRLLQLGRQPRPLAATDPNFPAFADRRYRWRDYETRLLTEDLLPCRQRPQAIDQDYLTSWNNKQAPGYRASDERFDWNSLDRVLAAERPHRARHPRARRR